MEQKLKLMFVITVTAFKKCFRFYEELEKANIHVMNYTMFYMPWVNNRMPFHKKITWRTTLFFNLKPYFCRLKIIDK